MGKVQASSLLQQIIFPWITNFLSLSYNSVAETRRILDQTRAAGIPIDTQWNDIDYMENHNDFTVNQESFADLPDFVDYVHSVGLATSAWSMVMSRGPSREKADRKICEQKLLWGKLMEVSICHP